MTLYATADWGPLVVNTDVDNAVLGVMQLWLPTYLTQVTKERNLTATPLPLPKLYTNVMETDEWLDYQIPAVLVTTARTLKTEGGPNYQYQAQWRVVVSCVVRGRIAQETRLTASLYEGAVRRCFLNKCRGENTPLNDPAWVGTEVAPWRERTDESRYLAAGIGTYNVWTDAAAQGFGGPDVPNATAYTPLATATEIDILLAQAESED